MGYLVFGRCYDTSAEGQEAYWSSQGAVLAAAPPSVVVVEKVSGSWVLDEYQSGSLVSSVAAPSVSFASCDPAASVADGVELGFLVVGAWVAAWAFHVLRKPVGV